LGVRRLFLTEHSRKREQSVQITEVRRIMLQVQAIKSRLELSEVGRRKMTGRIDER
jgi:hypothetical protein